MHRFRNVAVLVIALVLAIGSTFAVGIADEHPAEHPGAEAKEFTAAEIKKAMMDHINKGTKAGGGAFKLKDADGGGRELSLKFVQIHDPVRKIAGKRYFACIDFQAAGGAKGQLYDIDFWLAPKDGQLVVTETKVHKVPVKNGATWAKKERYNFDGDKPVVVN
ncbi:MAG: hypothetical protein A2V83_09280 [Nitrospirae bacterium RBG_16_64_22]|nr:MAG: hypothetical protein A2V83_09280 [Nitrospirae bacterium RBG_16_64_22]